MKPFIIHTLLLLFCLINSADLYSQQASAPANTPDNTPIFPSGNDPLDFFQLKTELKNIYIKSALNQSIIAQNVVIIDTRSGYSSEISNFKLDKGINKLPYFSRNATVNHIKVILLIKDTSIGIVYKITLSSLSCPSCF